MKRKFQSFFRLAARVGCAKHLATNAPDEWPYTVKATSWGQNPAYRPTGVFYWFDAKVLK
jgi:hypothetical protein